MLRDRVNELRRVKAADLRRNPNDWRLHPDRQKGVLQAMLEEVGFVGALVARETDAGLGRRHIAAKRPWWNSLRYRQSFVSPLPQSVVNLYEMQGFLVVMNENGCRSPRTFLCRPIHVRVLSRVQWAQRRWSTSHARADRLANSRSRSRLHRFRAVRYDQAVRVE